MLLGVFLFLSGISYNPIDLVETGGTLNIFGILGANIADVFLQYMGLAFYIIPICLLRWAFLLIRDRGFLKYKQKLSTLFFALVLLCFLLGSIKKYEFTFTNLIGGYIGYLTSELLIKTPFFVPFYALSVLLFFVSFIFTMDARDASFVTKIIKIITIKKATKPTKKTKKEATTKRDIEEEVFEPAKSVSGTKNIASRVNSFIKYLPPSVSLLLINSTENQKKNQKNLGFTKQVERELSKSLADFGIEAAIKGSKVGPVITMYEIEPKAGIRAARVIGLADDIARSLKAKSARISLIPGNSSLAVEIPNIERETVFFREIVDSVEFKESNFNIPIALGKSIAGDNIVVDLASMPHLLMAGTTGSGKSVGVNAMILSILYKLSPNDCQFIMIDPKMLELSVYNEIPHLLTPVVTEPEKAVMALKWLTFEMERRYRKMSTFSVRNIFGYNEAIAKLKSSRVEERSEAHPYVDTEELKKLKKMPFIVVIIDEMADLMITAGKMIEGYVQRLAQMARAAGIHVIMATQRPSVDVITGVIKANFPTRISYQVSSKIDSRTILGMQGAESLLGRGDMLYMPTGAKTYRIHSPFVSDDEVNSVVSYLKKTYGSMFDSIKIDIFSEIEAEGIEEEAVVNFGGSFTSDAKGDAKSEAAIYNEAVEIVITENKPSISYIQRRMKIGYNKAANLIERMEKEGIVSPAENATGKRIVLKKTK